MITQASIESLKSRLDVVDVVSSYITLKRAGVNFSAICPFHTEKTPSFIVSPVKQIYHCFSCGATGDSIKFVMEYEKISYPEALEKLADSNNFILEYDESSKKPVVDKSLEQIKIYYQKMLDTNQSALTYLANRGIGNDKIEEWEIGYAPSANEQINYAKSNFISIDNLTKNGVLGFNRSLYARFVNRIMFAIHNPNGKLVGFGGRIFDDGEGAKYINSPQSDIFNKSKLLYGYHKAKESIFRSKTIIVCEGYLDVIMLFGAGFKNVVATLGTALTKEHLPLLQKGEPKVIVSYDGDNAGRDAAFKASLLLVSANIDGGVVIFDGGLDPADMVFGGKTVLLEEKFSNPKNFVEYIIDTIASRKNLANPHEKKQALKEILNFMQSIDPIIALEYKNYLASTLSIDARLIKIKSIEQTLTTINTNKIDIEELAIIKSMVERKSFIDEALNYLEASMFRFHQEEYNLALSEQTDNPKIISLIINEEIKSLQFDEFISAIKKFAKSYKQNSTRQIALQNKPSSQKIAELIAHRKQLKQGD